MVLPMMDGFIVNVALPTIAADLGAGEVALALVVAGYGVAFTTLLVLGGRLGDAYGRRRVLRIGLVGFIVASLVCGLATDSAVLVAGRVAQGAFAALIPPQVLGTIQSSTEGRRRVRAISRYTAVTGVSATLGQVLGGLMIGLDVAGLSWRSIFLINIPVGLVVCAAMWRSVPDTRSDRSTGVDVAGTVLVAALLLALLVPFSAGHSQGWLWWTLASAPLLSAWLWRTEARVAASGRTALLATELLREPGVHRLLILLMLFLLGGGGFLYVFPFVMQGGLGNDPVVGGLAVVPMSLTFFLGTFAVPRLVRSMGRRVLSLGVLIQAAGLLLLAAAFVGWQDHPPVPATVPGMVLVGLGQAFAIGGASTLILAAVPVSFGGVGGGILVTAQQGSMAMGVAILGSVYAAALPGAGFATAFLLVLGTQILVAVVIALGVHTLLVQR